MNRWQNTYDLGLKCIENNELKEAYDYGVDCLTIVKKKFSTSSVREQVVSLDQYYHSIYLLKECSEIKKCKGCIEGTYLDSIETLHHMSQNSYYDLKVNKKANDLLASIKEDMTHFYEKNKMHYQLALLTSKYNKCFNPLKLIKG